MLSKLALLYISLSMYIYANQAFYAFLISPLLLAHVIFVAVGQSGGDMARGNML